MSLRWAAYLGALVPCLLTGLAAAEEADAIFHHGKIVTVDRNFSIQRALAVKDGRLLFVGANDEALKLRGDGTRVVDLAGRMVVPGLLDSHSHPTGAAMTEFDHPIPEMETIADVLATSKPEPPPSNRAIGSCCGRCSSPD